jgi:MerR family copper efflux transcriptional regulator
MTDSTSAQVLACSLAAPAAAERAQRWRSLLDGDLLDAGPIEGGRRLVFRSGPGIAAELDELVAAERECCPFLTLTVARSDERLVLGVVAPPEAVEIVATMFAAATPR